jgi:hypothetical protein
MDGCNTSETIGSVRGRFADSSAPQRLAPAREHTVWSIDLRRGSPVARIAIEQIAGAAAYRVLVDEVEVGRSDSVELVLRYVHCFEADPDRASRTRDRVQDRLEAR